MSQMMCSRCGMLVNKCECRVVFGMTAAAYDARLAEQRRKAQERFERDVVEKFKAANDARIAGRSHPSLGLTTAEDLELSIAALIADAEAICIHAAKDAET